MDFKQMQIHSNCLIVREMQIKTTIMIKDLSEDSKPLKILEGNVGSKNLRHFHSNVVF